jgi:hypothetical protein
MIQKNIAICSLMMILLIQCLHAQKVDSLPLQGHFSGNALVTNNGISLIPTFSLGKPAAIFNMSVGTRKLSFEPEFRFSLEGKPWSFLFWWRYNLLKTNKFLVKLGAHPALNFKTETIVSNGSAKEAIITRRYLAGEFSPNYFLTKNISVGMYYLYSRGLEKDATRNTHFVTVNCNFSHLSLPKSFFLKLVPQLYYLKMDKLDGYYATATITLGRDKFPLTISAIVNKVIQTRITASKDFVWNASLVYSFDHKYNKVK